MQPVTTFSPAKLRHEMVVRGLSMENLAKRAGLHRNTISSAMGRGRCEPETLTAIGRVLDEVKPIVGIMAIQRRREVPTDMTVTPEQRIANYHRARGDTASKSP